MSTIWECTLRWRINRRSRWYRVFVPVEDRSVARSWSTIIAVAVLVLSIWPDNRGTWYRDSWSSFRPEQFSMSSQSASTRNVVRTAAGQPAAPPIFRLLTPWSVGQTTFRRKINSASCSPTDRTYSNKNTPEIWIMHIKEPKNGSMIIVVQTGCVVDTC